MKKERERWIEREIKRKEKESDIIRQKEIQRQRGEKDSGGKECKRDRGRDAEGDRGRDIRQRQRKRVKRRTYKKNILLTQCIDTGCKVL